MSADRGRSRPRYRGVLFDLDGTLVDSLELILSSYRHTMAEHLGRVPPDEEWLRTMGRPLKEQLREFADSDEGARAMFETYLEHNERHHDRLVRSFPGMREAVGALGSRGYRLAVVTSKLRDQAIREIGTCGLDGHFEVLVCADDVERPKPDPEPVRQAIDRLGLAPGELLFVGDSIYDLQAGDAAGVDTAAALWGPFDREQLAPGQPEYWLETIPELLRLLSASGHPAHG